MSYQVLARKWRPKQFEDLVGQTHVVRALTHALDNDRLHHAYLFTGTRGIGKTTAARILARALNCEVGVNSTPCGECSACVEIDEGRFVDLIEVDAASRTRVEETRELLDNVQYAPTRGRFKVYLIDEVHMFSNHSFNALLKTLEEPPPHIKFLLATTDPKKLPATILSRCLQFNLKRLSPILIERQTEHILKEEKIASDRESRRLIAAAADGSLRDGLSLLDQAVAYGGGELRADDVITMLGTVAGDQVLSLIELLATGDAKSVLDHVTSMADRDPDYMAVLGELLTQLQRIAIRQMAPEFKDDSDGDDSRIEQLATRLSPEQCQLFYQIALIGRRDLPHNMDLRGGFEMVLLRMLAFDRVDQDKTSTTLQQARRGAAPEPPSKSTAIPENDKDNYWRTLIDELQLNGLVKELASHCVFVQQQDNKFRLLLSNDHLRNKNVEVRLEQALKERFGTDLQLIIESADLRDRNSPNAIKLQEADARRKEAEQAIESDPNVARLREAFDATVDKASIRARMPTETES